MMPARSSRAALAVACGLTVAIGALIRAGSQDPPQQPTFRSGANAVAVDVSVRDKSRRAVTGLKAADFEVFDNGVRQDVADVSYGRLPIDVTIALDVSFSVTGVLLDRLRRGVAQLMGDLGRQDRLKLVLFNMQVNRSVDFTTEVRVVERAIREARAGGGTALRDALSVALVSASAPDRRQLIVFFTDGGDSSSITTPAMLTNVAQRTRATLTFVMPSLTAMPLTYSSSTSSTGATTTIMSAAGINLLNSFRPVDGLYALLARETGGSVLPVGANTDLSVAFRRVLDEFRSAYVLYFNARGVDRGGYHVLEVKVKREGAIVQARRGYFGG